MRRSWPFPLLLVWILTAPVPGDAVELHVDDIDLPPHLYHQRPLRDPFTALKPKLESGALPLERGTEKAFLISLLKALDIPVSSQLWVFSTTSLQLRLISPSNPRALYFNDELYVGFIPGGRIEILSLDPDLGGIYYIFSIPAASEPIQVERSDRCMKCHAGEQTGGVPGIVIKSVVPGPTGGSLNAFRQLESGHGIPFHDRFGGWHVTGGPNLTNHWGNLTGSMSAGVITRVPNLPGEAFNVAKYPAATSDLLAHLLLEHQAGFANRVIAATYRAREIAQEAGATLPAKASTELQGIARDLVRYILFADEAPLPQGGVSGDDAFKRAFLKNRHVAGGRSLKDLQLTRRLFTHRCSYMVYTPLFLGMPPLLRQEVARELASSLAPGRHDGPGAALEEEEKQAIREILRTTLPEFPLPNG